MNAKGGIQMRASPLRAAKVSHNLAYHEITRAKPLYLYSVSIAQFEEHVSRVARLNACEELPGEAIRVTFDDGHVSQFEQGLPVLEQCSVKAMFFVTAGWMGRRAGYMSWPQVAKLSALGHEVQSHGWSHAFLTRCSNQELACELRQSKIEIENQLGKSVDAISVPGGRWDPRVLEACSYAGYRRVFLSDPWILPRTWSGLQVEGRWMITHQMSAERIATLLEGEGMGLRLLRARSFAKNAAQRILGDNAYQYLWNKLARKQDSLELAKEDGRAAGVQSSPD